MNKISHSVKRIIIVLLVTIILGGIAGGVYYGIEGYKFYKEETEIKPVAEMLERIQSKESFTEYKDLPQIYIDAVISAEDKRFERHPGIDVLAIMRAAATDLRTMSFVEGGSTITQQLAKNELFTHDKNFTRKFAEIFAAFELEKEYTKEEIFEMYVNSIYFGDGYYGVGEASEGYFGKTPQELEDWQCVLLAGLPNAPSVYTPSENPDLAVKRMSVVLRRMIACKKIANEAADDIYDAARDYYFE